MNLANKLTLIRISLIPLFMFFLYLGPYLPGTAEIIAVAIFIIAAGTDKIDGYIARKYDMITTFGKVMDPVADKLLIAAVFISLADLQPAVSAWPVILIIAREFLVSALRMIAASEGEVIPANRWGKIKTSLQVFASFLLILHPVVFYLPGAIPVILIWVTAVFTLYSGLIYFRQADIDFFSPPDK